MKKVKVADFGMTPEEQKLLVEGAQKILVPDDPRDSETVTVRLDQTPRRRKS